MSSIPPTGALFAAFLGYNPVHTILISLPQSVVAAISPATIATLTGTTWFPTTLAYAFMPSVRISFYIGALLSVIAAVLSAMTGSRFVHEMQMKPKEKTEEPPEIVEDTAFDIT
jgi:membrane protein implicated in regulation of membrane protease activity